MTRTEGEKQLERAAELLSGIPGGLERALYNALNRGTSTMKSRASKEIRRTYHIKAGDLNEYGGMKIGRATKSNLIGTLSYGGQTIPLYRFNVTPALPSPGRRVSAQVKKDGSPKGLEHVFVARMPKGHVGLYERLSKKRFPIEEKFGPSVPGMMAEDEARQAVEEAGWETFYKRLDHEVSRILSGYGGQT